MLWINKSGEEIWSRGSTHNFLDDDDDDVIKNYTNCTHTSGPSYTAQKIKFLNKDFCSKCD